MSDAQQRARQRYELKRQADPTYRQRKVEQQRARRARQRERWQRQEELRAVHVEARNEAAEVEAGKGRVEAYMRQHSLARMSCEGQRQAQRDGSLRCIQCGLGRVRLFQGGVWACAACNEQPVCACCRERECHTGPEYRLQESDIPGPVTG